MPSPASFRILFLLLIRTKRPRDTQWMVDLKCKQWKVSTQGGLKVEQAQYNSKLICDRRYFDQSPLVLLAFYVLVGLIRWIILTPQLPTCCHPKRISIIDDGRHAIIIPVNSSIIINCQNDTPIFKGNYLSIPRLMLMLNLPTKHTVIKMQTPEGKSCELVTSLLSLCLCPLCHVRQLRSHG